MTLEYFLIETVFIFFKLRTIKSQFRKINDIKKDNKFKAYNCTFINKL